MFTGTPVSEWWTNWAEVLPRRDSARWSTMFGLTMVLDGNSDIGAHVYSNLFYLICFRHLIWPRAVTNRIFSSKNLFFFMRAQHVLSHHLISVPWSWPWLIPLLRLQPCSGTLQFGSKKNPGLRIRLGIRIQIWKTSDHNVIINNHIFLSKKSS